MFPNSAVPRRPIGRPSCTAADVCDHFPPGCRQDHADRKAVAVRRRRSDGGAGAGAREPAADTLGLARDRARARHFGHLVGHDVRAQGNRLQSARYAGPCGFQRGHVSHAERGGRGGHGDRRREGDREPDAQAVRGMPAARHPDHHLHQQDRPRGTRSARAAGRDFIRARAGPDLADLAGRHGRRFPRRARYRGRAPAASDGRRGPTRSAHRATGEHSRRCIRMRASKSASRGPRWKAWSCA